MLFLCFPFADGLGILSCGLPLPLKTLRLRILIMAFLLAHLIWYFRLLNAFRILGVLIEMREVVSPRLRYLLEFLESLARLECGWKCKYIFPALEVRHLNFLLLFLSLKLWFWFLLFLEVFILLVYSQFIQALNLLLLTQNSLLFFIQHLGQLQ